MHDYSQTDAERQTDAQTYFLRISGPHQDTSQPVCDKGFQLHVAGRWLWPDCRSHSCILLLWVLEQLSSLHPHLRADTDFPPGLLEDCGSDATQWAFLHTQFKETLFILPSLISHMPDIYALISFDIRRSIHKLKT